MTQTQTHSQINVGLTDGQRQGVCEILNRTLADLAILYTKTRNYHWNVTGMQFHSLHEVFEEQYQQIAEASDEVAERVRMLGEHPIGTMAEFLQHSQLTEMPGDYPDAPAMITNLLSDHEQVINQLRRGVQVTDDHYADASTSDFLTELLQQHEKMAWMLRAFVE